MQLQSQKPLILECGGGTRILTRGCVFAAVTLLAAHLAIGPFVTESVKDTIRFELVGVVFWGSMVVLMLVELRRVSRQRLEIAADTITIRESSKAVRIRLQDVTSLKWHRNEVKLLWNGGATVINLSQYEPQPRFELLRRLRNGVPTEWQSGWESFFCRSVLPLLRCKLLPGPGEFVATRRRWDVIFSVALLPAVAVAWFSWHVTQQPRMLLIPLLLAPLWLLVRRSTPRRGMIVRSSTDRSNNDLPFMLGMVSFIPLTFAGIILHRLYGETAPGLNLALVVGALPLLASILAIAIREDRRRHSRRQTEQAELVARYDWLTGWPHEIDFERRTTPQGSS